MNWTQTTRPSWRILVLTLGLVGAALMVSGIYLLNQTESNITRTVESCSAPCNVPPAVWDYPEGAFGFFLQGLGVAMYVANVPIIYVGGKRGIVKPPEPRK